jgi:hypothetical protein
MTEKEKETDSSTSIFKKWMNRPKCQYVSFTHEGFTMCSKTCFPLPTAQHLVQVMKDIVPDTVASDSPCSMWSRLKFKCVRNDEAAKKMLIRFPHEQGQAAMPVQSEQGQAQPGQSQG